ncbi:MAG: hypothetical protein AAF492_10405, partial [Verrucomicrobiota bacterium]
LAALDQLDDRRPAAWWVRPPVWAAGVCGLLLLGLLGFRLIDRENPNRIAADPPTKPDIEIAVAPPARIPTAVSSRSIDDRLASLSHAIASARGPRPTPRYSREDSLASRMQRMRPGLERMRMELENSLL